LKRLVVKIVFALLLAVFLSSASALAQAEFSAVIVDTKGDPNAKIYFAKDKIRVEPAQIYPRSGGGVFIMNLATQTSIVLMDQQHLYREMPSQMAQQQQGVGYILFSTNDVEAACPDWSKNVNNKGGTCDKAGNDTVNGRSTVKYQTTNAKGDTGYFWIDSELRFPVRWQGKNGTWELRNIQEGSQPASLFEVPPGYTWRGGTLWPR
jgi:hypothetical protein